MQGHERLRVPDFLSLHHFSNLVPVQLVYVDLLGVLVSRAHVPRQARDEQVYSLITEPWAGMNTPQRFETLRLPTDLLDDLAGNALLRRLTRFQRPRGYLPDPLSDGRTKLADEDDLALRGDGDRAACAGMFDDPEGLAIDLTFDKGYDGTPRELLPPPETYRLFSFRRH